MGTLTSVTDVNPATTSAGYDLFGRMQTLVKPGDSPTYPTMQAIYGGTDLPFRYQVAQRQQAGTGNLRYRQSFYDGLGRQIQTKQEGGAAWQNSTTDSVYDGLNHVIRPSQPRFAQETGTSFWHYTPVTLADFEGGVDTRSALSGLSGVGLGGPWYAWENPPTAQGDDILYSLMLDWGE